MVSISFFLLIDAYYEICFFFENSLSLASVFFFLILSFSYCFFITASPSLPFINNLLLLNFILFSSVRSSASNSNSLRTFRLQFDQKAGTVCCKTQKCICARLHVCMPVCQYIYKCVCMRVRVCVRASYGPPWQFLECIS